MKVPYARIIPMQGRMTDARSPAIILYLVSEDRAFVSHRLPMARAARSAGFEVHVATHFTVHTKKIVSEGFVIHPIPFKRGGISPFATLKTIAAIRRLERQLNPAVVHHSGLQCCVLGELAATAQNIRRINALTGLGYVFTSQSFIARMARVAVAALLRILLNRPNSIALVQNPDDRAILEELGIQKHIIALIPGSGVDTDELLPLPEPDGPITVGFAGRLLTDKGIRTLVRAHRILRSRGLNSNLLIAGEPDDANPTTIPVEEALAWNEEPGITWLGQIEDIKSLWIRSHIAALPSLREGLPKTLLEAAAFGRPMLATDTPGCREIVLDKKTGLLVPIDAPTQLADALELLINSKKLRETYGAAARQLVVEKMSSQSVGSAIVALYRSGANEINCALKNQ